MYLWINTSKIYWFSIDLLNLDKAEIIIDRRYIGKYILHHLTNLIGARRTWMSASLMKNLTCVPLSWSLIGDLTYFLPWVPKVAMCTLLYTYPSPRVCRINVFIAAMIICFSNSLGANIAGIWMRNQTYNWPEGHFKGPLKRTVSYLWFWWL